MTVTWYNITRAKDENILGSSNGDADKLKLDIDEGTDMGCSVGSHEWSKYENFD